MYVQVSARAGFARFSRRSEFLRTHEVIFTLAFVIGFLVNYAAQAQSLSPSSIPTIPGVTVPAAVAPPAAGNDTAAQGYFPALPPSTKCTKEDVSGFWRLVQVYETPFGAQTAAFSAEPFQYALFDADGTYTPYRNTQNTNSEQAIYDQLAAQKNALLQQVAQNNDQVAGSQLQQYLIQDGIVFIYMGGQAGDTLACFIVANGTGPYSAGQMLMMPPKGTVPVNNRWIKIYAKAALQPNAAPNDNARVMQKTRLTPQERAARRQQRQRQKNQYSGDGQ